MLAQQRPLRHRQCWCTALWVLGLRLPTVQEEASDPACLLSWNSWWLNLHQSLSFAACALGADVQLTRFGTTHTAGPPKPRPDRDDAADTTSTIPCDPLTCSDTALHGEILEGKLDQKLGLWWLGHVSKAEGRTCGVVRVVLRVAVLPKCRVGPHDWQWRTHTVLGQTTSSQCYDRQ